MKISNAEFEQKMAIAHKPNLTQKEYKEAKSFFLKCQSTFTPPHTWIPKVSAALQTLEHHKPIKINFFQTPLGLILIAGLGGVLTYGILLSIGWVTLPN
jgi:hypothetical protein